jgi:drug/metabolite transporter (DMT)-like permease
MTRAQAGLLLMLAGAAVDSTSGLFTRALGADGFTAAGGRSFFAFLLLAGLLAVQARGAVWRRIGGIGALGLVFAGLAAAGQVMTILSLSNTSVANFFLIFASAPFVAAVMGWAVLGERPDGATLLAALAGLAGMAVMLGGGGGGNLLGDLLAVGCVLMYSAIVLIVRGKAGFDTLAVLCVTMLLAGLVALPMGDFAGFTPRQWGLLALMGMGQLAIGNLLIFAAAARIPPAQSGLLGILNAAFAPAWVFVGFGEVPPAATLLGGGIILAAAVAHLVWTLRRPPA